MRFEPLCPLPCPPGSRVPVDPSGVPHQHHQAGFPSAGWCAGHHHAPEASGTAGRHHSPSAGFTTNPSPQTHPRWPCSLTLCSLCPVEHHHAGRVGQHPRPASGHALPSTGWLCCGEDPRSSLGRQHGERSPLPCLNQGVLWHQDRSVMRAF